MSGRAQEQTDGGGTLRRDHRRRHTHTYTTEGAGHGFKLFHGSSDRLLKAPALGGRTFVLIGPYHQQARLRLGPPFATNSRPAARGLVRGSRLVRNRVFVFSVTVHGTQTNGRWMQHAAECLSHLPLIPLSRCQELLAGIRAVFILFYLRCAFCGTYAGHDGV